MGRVITTLLMISLIIGSLAACGDADMEGILLEVRDGSVLLSEDLSPEEYADIKDESATNLQNEDVAGERASLRLLDLTYDQTAELHKGDQVEVWLKGDIMTSYPGQAEAKKIVVKK